MSATPELRERLLETSRNMNRPVSSTPTRPADGGALTLSAPLGASPSPDTPQQTLVVVVLIVLAVMQLQRLLSAMVDPLYGGDHVTRELMMAGLGGTGLWLFWNDSQQGRLYEGVLKLVALLGLAYLLLPCLWPTMPNRPACNDDSDDVTVDDDPEQDLSPRRAGSAA